MSEGRALLINGEPVENDDVGEMTRALRRLAEYSQWDDLAIGRRVTLPDIEDVGAYLGDPRWDGWAARLEVKRLADDARSGYRRWRIAVRLAMPGWFANLQAVYVDAVPPFAAANEKRHAVSEALATEAEALRAAGMTIEEAADHVERTPTTIVRYRKRKRSDLTIS